MLTTISSLSLILILLILILKINTTRKIKLLDHIMATIFLFIGIFSVQNIFNGDNIFLINKLFHIGNLENYFLLIFSVLGFATSFYSDFYFGEYLKHGKKLKFYYIFLYLFIFSMLGVIIANEAIIFLIFWEIMSVSSYFLVIHEYKKKGVLKDGSWYLIITHIGMFFILLSFIPFIINNESTLFSNWANTNLDNVIANFAFFSALIGFGSKAGLFPVHIWLPKAHPIAPTNISALMSGFMVKLPVLMILKFLIVFVGMKVQFSWFIITLLIASISSFIGIFYAIIQSNIKKLLAYSTVENIGIIFIGISISIFGMYVNNNGLIALGIFASLYHTFNHTIFKGLLFLVSGGMIERTSTYKYSEMGALIKSFPFLAISFLIGAIAIAGIMPLNGFNSEFLTYISLFKAILLKTSFSSVIVIIISIILLSSTAVLSVICFTKVFGIAFLGNKKDIKLKYKNIESIGEKIAYSVLIISIIILTIIPGFIYLVVSKILNLNYNSSILSFGNLNLNYSPILTISIISIFLIISYIIYKILSKKEVIKPVWNCGYGYIEPSTQYTSTSFTQPIRKIFANIYGESRIYKKNKILDEKTFYKKHLSNIEYSVNNKYFIDNIYSKFINLISNIAKNVKSLQNGEIQSYVFYMFLAVIISFIILLFI